MEHSRSGESMRLFLLGLVEAITSREGERELASPSLALVLTVLALNLLGDGLNDALNPRLAEHSS